MANTMIDNSDILKNPKDEKRLKSALNRVAKATKEITDLGYSIYVSAHGGFNVMNTDDVPYLDGVSYRTEQVVASTQLRGVDCGDW